MEKDKKKDKIIIFLDNLSMDKKEKDYKKIMGQFMMVNLKMEDLMEMEYLQINKENLLVNLKMDYQMEMDSQN